MAEFPFIIVQIFVVLVTLAGLILNIIFVYVPVAKIQADIKRATDNINFVAHRIDLLIENWEPKLDKILHQTQQIEDIISNTFTVLGLASVNTSSLINTINTYRQNLTNQFVNIEGKQDFILAGLNQISTQITQQCSSSPPNSFPPNSFPPNSFPSNSFPPNSFSQNSFSENAINSVQGRVNSNQYCL